MAAAASSGGAGGGGGQADRRAQVAATVALASLEATQSALVEQLEESRAAVAAGRAECANIRRDQRAVHAGDGPPYSCDRHGQVMAGAPIVTVS